MRNILIRTASFSFGIFIYQVIFKEASFIDSLERAIFVGTITSLLVSSIATIVKK